MRRKANQCYKIDKTWPARLEQQLTNYLQKRAGDPNPKSIWALKWMRLAVIRNSTWDFHPLVCLLWGQQLP